MARSSLGIFLQNLASEIPFFATNPFIGYYDSDGKEQNNMGEAYFEVDANDNPLIKSTFDTNNIFVRPS